MITRRKAKKPHVCTYGCGRWIKSGSIYLRHAVRREGSRTALDSLAECSMCATAHGRAGLLEVKS
jgi:hypothetical protein